MQRPRVSTGQVWKVLGLAAVLGVAATGVVLVRSQRKRRAYTPDQIRERLHARLAAADATTAGRVSP